MEFKVVPMGNSLGVRIPSKVLKVFKATKDTLLVGELRGSELILRASDGNGPQEVIDLIHEATGLDPKKPEDLSAIKALLTQALAGTGKAVADD